MLFELLAKVFPPELLGGLLGLALLLFAMAMIVSIVVQFLKKEGYIPDGDAGKWNGYISSILVVLTFLVTQIFGGSEADIHNATQFAEAIATLLTSQFVVSALARIYYAVAKFIGMFKTREELVLATARETAKAAGRF